MPDRQVSPAAVQATLIGAMAIWGLNVAAVKVLTGVFDPTTVAALRMLVACAALSLIVLWKRCGLAVHATLESPAIGFDGMFPGWRPWVFILFSGVMATALSNLVWNRAIARIGVASTAVFLYWVPVFGVGFAAMLLGERLNLWHLFGFLAVMGGTYLGTRQPATAPVVAPN